MTARSSNPHIHIRAQSACVTKSHKADVSYQSAAHGTYIIIPTDIAEQFSERLVITESTDGTLSMRYATEISGKGSKVSLKNRTAYFNPSLFDREHYEGDWTYEVENETIYLLEKVNS